MPIVGDPLSHAFLPRLFLHLILHIAVVLNKALKLISHYSTSTLSNPSCWSFINEIAYHGLIELDLLHLNVLLCVCSVPIVDFYNMTGEQWIYYPDP